MVCAVRNRLGKELNFHTWPTGQAPGPSEGKLCEPGVVFVCFEGVVCVFSAPAASANGLQVGLVLIF